MKIDNWYQEETATCLKQLLDSTYDPNMIHNRGFLDRGDFVLDVLERFISISMFLGHNPLPHLRESFPFLEWRYENYGHDDYSGKHLKICMDVNSCDFFWFVAGQRWRLVLATRKEFEKNQEPLSLFGSVSEISEEEFGDSLADQKYLRRYYFTKKIIDQK